MRFLRFKPRIAKLDLNNPLTKGLVFCVPLDEGGGNPRDIVNNQYSTLNSNNTNPAWNSSGRAGNSVSNTARAGGFSDGQYNFANNPAFEVGVNFTVSVLAYQSSFAAGINGLIGVDKNFGFSYSNFQGEGNDWFSCKYWDAGGTIRRMGVAGAPSTGVWRNYAFTVVNSLPANIYYDGIAQSTSTGTGSQARDTTGILRFGGYGDLLNNWGSQIDVMWIWNRVLTQAELLSITRDPYQVFASESRRDYFKTNPVVTYSTMTGIQSATGIQSVTF